jgi:ABC-2 type transport system ATP-binding protein
MHPAIQTQALRRDFGRVRAVDGIDLTVEAGEVFGLLGPNGAGKTTLVRLLNGIIEADSGTMRVLGFDPAAQGGEVRARAGVLTETPALYERLTARDNLLFFGTLYGVAASELNHRVDNLLAQFGLDERADDRAAGFSKGMKQRLALARTLIHQPALLYFDEPTSGLDPEAAREVSDLIATLSHQQGRTVMLCTHNLDEAQRLCDRVAVINQGRLLAFGQPQQLARDLWQGVWVDISFTEPPPPSLPETLRGVRGVLDLTLNGSELIAQVESDAAIPALVAALVQGGGLVRRVQPREHSLADIYFRLQEEAKL